MSTWDISSELYESRYVERLAILQLLVHSGVCLMRLGNQGRLMKARTHTPCAWCWNGCMASLYPLLIRHEILPSAPLVRQLLPPCSVEIVSAYLNQQDAAMSCQWQLVDQVCCPYASTVNLMWSWILVRNMLQGIDNTACPHHCPAVA